MARHLFGAGPASWTFANDGATSTMAGGVTVQAFNQQVGGTQYVDLSLDVDGTQIVDHVTSSDTTDGLQLGQVPPFYGPDGVWQMWLSANGGPRVLVVATDVGLAVAQNQSDILNLTQDLAEFEATKGADNGLASLGSDGLLDPSQRWTPSFSLASATDVAVGTQANGDILVYNSSTSKYEKVSTAVSWTTLTMNNGSNGFTNWVGRVRKVPVTGQIELQLFGNVGTTAQSSDKTVTTLPVGFRPTWRDQAFPLITNNSGGMGRFDVKTDGTVVVQIRNNSSGDFAQMANTFTP